MKKSMGLFTAMMLVLVLALAACSSGDSKKSESSGDGKDTFTVGMEAGYAPFNWTQKDDSNGAVKIDGNAEYAGGYDVQIAKKIADSMGKKLVIVKTEWDGLIPGLISGKIDAVIAGMSPTPERKKSVDFSDIYYASNLVMVVKSDGKYADATSIDDFSGAKITGQLNTSHYTVIDQIKGVKKETAADNFSAMRVALESGKIDGYVSERPEGISASAANDKYKMIEFKDGSGFKADPVESSIAVGVKKDSELTKEINKALEKITEEERQQLMETEIKNQPAAK
ncbi:MAG: transporter substrate-binding domain-containing protein [Kurthia sp.]|uniref:Amino acid ABC transporter substrate-binding protein (PAAT family) n=1 Tax=Kurthia zopfii TaxID=1650 RepID=A0A8B4QF12_9BACL|nr:transporter substrate-binding domain-containing protein [Kurthia zopfii]PWI21289.1 ABC transporter substrate-binding protein [Kurthia zopfii]TDR33952.1 amino acid ABC transporter substrate-binding protein (PAAT family) [Kurthia zopfii]GEK31884.1 ABC transporter substrate-binding protein [Kurthia zopfii]STX11194.1 Arginine-binding extracellular protein ArtP precursor [Kurthia zopfii]